ncbi:MAG: hypothetical protein J6X28_02875 [Bacilli bacterium]|nr:hypothetical protein [Bacilli bacterium]
MGQELESLVTLLKTTIEQCEQQVEDIQEQNHSAFEKYNQNLALLEDDYQNITQISPEGLAEVLSEVDLTEEDRETEFSFLRSIRRLLELNQTKQTTFQLSEKQKQILEDFKNQLRMIGEKNEAIVKENWKKASSLADRIKDLKYLLGILEDPKNKNYINQMDLILELLEQEDVSEEEARSILYGIMRYNQAIQKEINSLEEKPQERLNVEELKEIFASFRYDFLDLKEDLQEMLLNQGKMNQILEVFDALDTLRFPRLDLRRNGIKLVAILLKGDAATMQEIVELASSKGLYPKDLYQMIPAMISQKEDNRESKESLSIRGRSEDFKKNVAFLEEVGFLIPYIFRKCKELLVMPNAKLVSNYQKFIQYGFTMKTDMYGELMHPALSCLLSNNFDEVVDQFIEVSREGHQYIKENMSRATTITSPDDLVFYNIYASYLDHTATGDYIYPEGPFTSTNHRTLRLRGEITRYAGSGYENTSYRGITEENKHEKTMTVEMTYPNQEDFLYAVADAKGREEELEDLVEDDPRILELESYTDPSDPQRYDLEGVLISKLKVKRILNILKNYQLDQLEDSLLFALTYHSILSQEDLEKIKKIIQDRRK